jgi:hypothetical protein
MFWSQPKPCAKSIGCAPLTPASVTLFRWTTPIYGSVYILAGAPVQPGTGETTRRKAGSAMRFQLEDVAAVRDAVAPQWREHVERIAVELGALRERLGSEEGRVRDDVGGTHAVSLAAWRDAPAGTRLVASFSYEHDGSPARVYLHDVLGRIVLEQAR